MRKQASPLQPDGNPKKIISSEPILASNALSLPAEVAELLQEALATVQYGTVQITIQDGRVVQIDTTIKKRLV